MTPRAAIAAAAFFAMILITVSCKHSTGPSPISASYPFAAGNTWSYILTDSLTNMKRVDPGWNPTNAGMHLLVTATCQGKITLQNSPVWWMHFTYDDGTYSGDQYYSFPNDTLKSVAYSGSNLMGLPKHASTYRYRCGGRTFASLADLKKNLIPENLSGETAQTGEITYETDPPVVLIFPLTGNRDWDYRTGVNGFVRIHKTNIGSGIVDVPAGTFDAAIIQWQWHWMSSGYPGWDTTMTGVEYIGFHGLLKRQFIIKNILITDEQSNLLGTGDFVEQSVAVSLPKIPY